MAKRSTLLNGEDWQEKSQDRSKFSDRFHPQPARKSRINVKVPEGAKKTRQNVNLEEVPPLALPYLDAYREILGASPKKPNLAQISRNTLPPEGQLLERAKSTESLGNRLASPLHSGSGLFPCSPLHAGIFGKMKVKVQSNAYVSSDNPVSVILPAICSNSTQEVRLYYKNSELHPDLTFADQGVYDGCDIQAEPVLTLHCQISNREVALRVTRVDSIAKVKMDAAVAANLDLTQHYDLLLSSIRLADDSTVASAGLDPSSHLLLQQAQMSPSRTSDSQAFLKALVQAAFQNAIPCGLIIATDMNSQQLQQLGFGRHILDRILFYKMNMLYGTAGNNKLGKEMIKINVEVVSWKSLTMNFYRKQTVSEMKQELERKIKISKSEQFIIFNGRLLNDPSTLESCGIADGYSIIVAHTEINSYLFLPLEYFDKGGDFDYTGFRPPLDFGKRGGHDYFPPCGWYRFGLKVYGLFEDNTWLGMRGAPGEWIVSYHGKMVQTRQSIVRSVCGVCSFPHVKDAEAYASTFTCGGRNFKLLFMDRVNSASVKLQKSKGEGQGNPDFYVSATDSDIRLYGILLKPI